MAARRLILIHGFTERPSMWDELIAGLDIPDLLVSTPSIPGHGECPNIPAQHTSKAYCDALLKQLPQDDLPWIVVGHSMGGYLAAQLVQHVPERIRALGFFHSKAGADHAEKKEDRRRAIAIAQSDKNLYLVTMLRNTLAERNVELMHDQLSLMIEAAKNDITYECIVASHEVMIERPDAIAFLQSVNFPIHYFLGMEDKSIPYQQLTHELNSLPRATVQIVENAGHMGQIECKDIATQWLRKMCLC